MKKANQKRLLSEMTIEGGCFTTALLKKHHICELFENNDQLELISPELMNTTEANHQNSQTNHDYTITVEDTLE